MCFFLVQNADVSSRRVSDGKNGTDLAALADDRISITPLRLDLTDQPFLSKLVELFPTK